MVNKKAAVLVKDSEASSLLIKQAIDLLNNENKQMELKQQIKTLAFPNATSDIANEVLKLVSK